MQSISAQPQTLGIVHVLFMDIVGYSILSMNQQIKSLELLQEIVRDNDEFRRAQERAQLISLPTGDGLALVFFSHPVAPVQCAIEVSRAIKIYPEIKLRIGVHSGPIYQVDDINSSKNVAGSGINIAQRVMDCGDAGHILLSKRVADDLAQIGDWDEYLHDLGEFEVKHGDLVHIFNLYSAEVGNAEPPKKLRSQLAKKVQQTDEQKLKSYEMSKAEQLPTTVTPDSVIKQGRRRFNYKFSLLLIALTVGLVTLGLYRYLSVKRSATESQGSVAQVSDSKFYWQSTKEQQRQLIEEQAQRISMMLGPNPYKYSDKALSQIQQEVNNYVNRRDSLSSEIFKEGLRPLYSRASLYAPFIIQAFNERHVPPGLGLYIAMTETEYHPCDDGQFGGKGLFGFARGTAIKYGLDPNERCDPQKISRAAAHYIDDLISEFGSDSGSITLVILGYLRGEGVVRAGVRLLHDKGIKERSYWALATHADEGNTSSQEASQYLPKFFAAAIIGENPQAFDLQIKPLSTYPELKR